MEAPVEGHDSDGLLLPALGHDRVLAHGTFGSEALQKVSINAFDIVIKM